MLAAALAIFSLIVLPLQANAGLQNPTLTLDPVQDTNPVGTTHTINATLTGGIAGGLPIFFNITGANPGIGSCIVVGNFSDFTNRCSFSYVGVNAGHDDITATELIFNLTAEADKDWIAEQRLVAGEIMGIDTTALLVAGAMANSYWVIPTLGMIAGAVVAIMRATKNKTQKEK
jgi:hypothetical protein